VSQVDDAKAKRGKVYRALEDQVRWLRAEWHSDIPAKLHNVKLVDDGDHLGGPAWTARFRDYVGSGVLWVDEEPVRLEAPRGRLRNELALMATGSVLERRAARFLFALACLDFDPARAGLAMSVPLLPEYAYYYAEGAIGRLRQRCEQADRPWQLSRRGYKEIDADGNIIARRTADAVA